MKLTLATILASLAIASVAHAKKPAVCLSFTESTLPVDGVPTKVAICTDGKKPVVLTSYTVASVKGENGEPVKAAIGWR